MEFSGPASQGPVTLHVFHFAMEAVGQPLIEPRLVFLQAGIAKTDLLKPQLATPSANAFSQFQHRFRVCPVSIGIFRYFGEIH
jgi:hypothetical protein